MRVNRNYFGRQTESFEADLALPFLGATDGDKINEPFKGVFIRAPVVEKLLQVVRGEQAGESALDETVIAPARLPEGKAAEEQVLRPVEIMATLPGRSRTLREKLVAVSLSDEVGDIVAVRQANVFWHQLPSRADGRHENPCVVARTGQRHIATPPGKQRSLI